MTFTWQVCKTIQLWGFIHLRKITKSIYCYVFQMSCMAKTCLKNQIWQRNLGNLEVSCFLWKMLTDFGNFTCKNHLNDKYSDRFKYFNFVPVQWGDFLYYRNISVSTWLIPDIICCKGLSLLKKFGHFFVNAFICLTIQNNARIGYIHDFFSIKTILLRLVRPSRLVRPTE